MRQPRVLGVTGPDRVDPLRSTAVSTLSALASPGGIAEVSRSGVATGQGVATGDRVRSARASLGQAGLSGVAVPTRWGGLGRGVVGACVIADEAAAWGYPFALPGWSAVTVGSMLVHDGSPAQQERWLPGLASRAVGMALAVSEPDTGARLAAIRTMARQTGSGWLLAGAKRNITGASTAGGLAVLAATGDPGVLSVFLVPADAPGVVVRPIPGQETVLGSQDEIDLHDVLVGEGDLVGEPGAGRRVVFTALNPERLVVAATATGLARRLISLAVAEQSDGGSGSGVGVMGAYAQVEAARMAVQTAAGEFDATGQASEAVSVAKLAAGMAGQQAVQATVGLVPAEVHEQFDRLLGRLARFPVGPDQLAGYLLRHVGRYGRME